MTAPQINLTELRAEADSAIKCYESAQVNPFELLALITAVEAAREVAAGLGGYSDDSPSINRLREALAPFHP